MHTPLSYFPHRKLARNTKTNTNKITTTKTYTIVPNLNFAGSKGLLKDTKNHWQTYKVNPGNKSGGQTRDHSPVLVVTASYAKLNINVPTTKYHPTRLCSVPYVGLLVVTNPKLLCPYINRPWPRVNWPWPCAVTAPIDQNELLTQYLTLYCFFI
jgi:hypothetical protein